MGIDGGGVERDFGETTPDTGGAGGDESGGGDCTCDSAGGAPNPVTWMLFLGPLALLGYRRKR